MKAATYPEADHSAPTMPTTKTTPAAPRVRSSPWTAPVKMCWAGPGAILPRFVISGPVAEGPISPRMETMAISAGKMAWMP